MTEEERKAMRDDIIELMGAQLEGVNKQLEAISGSVKQRNEATATELERIAEEMTQSLEAMSSKGTAGAPPQGPVDTETGDPKCGFKHIGDMMGDVVLAAEQNRPTERMIKWEKMSEENAAKQKAAGTGFVVEDGERGGMTLPEEFKTEVWTRALDISNIMSKTFTFPVTSKSLKVPAMGGYDRSDGTLYGGIVFTDDAENAQISDVRPKFEQISFDLGRQTAMTHASDEMLRYSPITMETFIREKFSEALAWRIEYLLLNGSGAGQPAGIIGHPATVSQAAEDGQTAATVVFENIANMDARIYRETNAEWYFNRTVKPQLRTMSLAVGDGGSVLNWKEELDHPYNINEHCPAKGTVGDIFLGDFSQYGVSLPAGQGNGPAFQTSIHFKFDYAQTSFRFMWYMDGHPLWRTVETPRNGDTISPFVTLATRS